jgi:hypothetical protein
MDDTTDESLDQYIEENRDGTVIVTLRKPVKVAGEEYDRVTVHEMCSKHAGVAQQAFDDLDRMIELGDRLTSPPGACGATRTQTDLLRIGRAVRIQLGKWTEESKDSASA